MIWLILLWGMIVWGFMCEFADRLVHLRAIVHLLRKHPDCLYPAGITIVFVALYVAKVLPATYWLATLWTVIVFIQTASLNHRRIARQQSILMTFLSLSLVLVWSVGKINFVEILYKGTIESLSGWQIILVLIQGFFSGIFLGAATSIFHCAVIPTKRKRNRRPRHV